MMDLKQFSEGYKPKEYEYVMPDGAKLLIKEMDLKTRGEFFAKYRGIKDQKNSAAYANALTVAYSSPLFDPDDKAHIDILMQKPMSLIEDICDFINEINTFSPQQTEELKKNLKVIQT